MEITHVGFDTEEEALLAAWKATKAMKEPLGKMLELGDRFKKIDDPATRNLVQQLKALTEELDGQWRRLVFALSVFDVVDDAPE
jgi:hypothetical protein